jgi:hypothetical protein
MAAGMDRAEAAQEKAPAGRGRHRLKHKLEARSAFPRGQEL